MMPSTDSHSFGAPPLVNTPFIERRGLGTPEGPPGVERRQFANSYEELTPEARELARAVDEYKMLHRRRFVTYEELLGVVQSLGYRRST